jgi:hypothetical protein
MPGVVGDSRLPRYIWALVLLTAGFASEPEQPCLHTYFNFTPLTKSWEDRSLHITYEEQLQVAVKEWHDVVDGDLIMPSKGECLGGEVQQSCTPTLTLAPLLLAIPAVHFPPVITLK